MNLKKVKFWSVKANGWEIRKRFVKMTRFGEYSMMIKKAGRSANKTDFL